MIDVVKEKIEKEISRINNLTLFDDEFTSGKPWEVDELLRVNDKSQIGGFRSRFNTSKPCSTQELNNNIEGKSKVMTECAATVEGAINDIVMILTSSRVNSADHQQVERGQGHDKLFIFALSFEVVFKSLLQKRLVKAVVLKLFKVFRSVVPLAQGLFENPCVRVLTFN